MARAIRTRQTKANIYRHFAAVTIALTAVTAMFANSEDREALAREIAEDSRPAVDQAPPEFVRRTAAPRGSFGSEEFDGSFGQPMDGAGAAAGDGVIPGVNYAAPQAGMPVGFTVYGVTTAQWDAMNEEQRRRLMADREAANRAAQSGERARQVNALLEASRARSGAPSESLD
ncbi:hypothetical protein N0B51_03860 [Tsuneonella sp. YG55]|uniref:Uncharacterized protein n=1 Tax=Tsuneonella litorea TaxID=2976475 RepID=A0A9X2VZ75_9SPHN|nr:hypothetical protein [Tsuneonella litorea]MCT2558110.1 hypothetical protein [Tsuneonella litorea]